MINYFWVIILFNCIFGLLVSYLFYKLIIRNLSKKEEEVKNYIAKKFTDEINIEENLREFSMQTDLTKEVASVLDRHIDEIIKNISLQIPMGEFLVTGVIGQKIKNKVQQEVNKILPEVIEHLIQHVHNKLNLEKIIKKKIQGLDLKHLIETELAGSMTNFKWLVVLLSIFVSIMEAFTLNCFKG